MAKTLLTLSKSDPRFQKHLTGTFSKTERALPVQSLNINQSFETVTFEIVDLVNINKPNLISIILATWKIRHLIVTFFPILMILISLQLAAENFDGILASLNVLAVFFLSISVNLYNDYTDHLVGLDRVHSGSGSQAIQKGWVSAHQVLFWSQFFLLTGVLTGLPALFVFPHVLVLVGGTSLGLIFIFSSRATGFKFRIGAEAAGFLLLGPLLTTGFSVSLTGDWRWSFLFLGIFNGFLAVFFLHLKNFEMLFINHQAHLKNTISILGFEKSKDFLFVWWLVTLVLFVGLLFDFLPEIQSESFVVLIVGLSMVIFFALRTRKKLFQLQSPLDSYVGHFVKSARQSSFFLLLFLVILGLGRLLDLLGVHL